MNLSQKIVRMVYKLIFFLSMFSHNNAYFYQEPELELFQRQLPHKSIKLPIKNRERDQRILTQVQRKYQVQQLRMQIMDRCKFQELEYLQLLKRQRQLMEEDVKRRKQLIYQNKMELNIASNKNNQRQPIKIKDSLDRLQNQHEQDRYKPKTERTESDYSSSMSSFNKSRIVTPNIQNSHLNIMPMKAEKQVSKEEQVKKLKEQILNKYKFVGEDGKKPVKASEDNTQIKWWINKVRKYKQEEQKTENKPKQQNSTILSDTDSDVSVK